MESRRKEWANNFLDPIQLTGKCPWYSKSKKETSGGDDTTKTECPLHKSGCPYYERHKKDHSVNDVLQEPDHQCVLTEKCTFYKALKDGKLNTVDWTTSNCPLKDKW